MSEEYTEEDLRGCAAGDSPYSCMDEEVIDRIIAKIKADAVAEFVDLSRKSKTFWSMVDSSEAHGCWPWTGSRKGAGDVHGGFNGSTAHRYSWTIHNGAIPEGQVIRHKCDNPICVNPDHLESGSQQDNVMDMIDRNRAWFQSPQCVNGHTKSSDTVHITKAGKRVCLPCKKLWLARREEQERANKRCCAVCGKTIRSSNFARHAASHNPYREETK